MSFQPTGNAPIDAALAAMDAANSLDASLLSFFSTGLPKLIADAVAAAIANGATAAQLAPLTDLAATLSTSTPAVMAALLANTPVTPAQAKAKK